MRLRASVCIPAFCLAAFALPAVARGQDPAGPAAPADRAARVILLGTGTPILTAEHSGNSVAVLVHRALYVFDAGPGMVTRLTQAMARGIAFDTVPAVFITHLHSDHTLGLPALLYDHGPSTRLFAGGGPLVIFGPPGIRDMMTHIRAAWALDRDVRTRDRTPTREGNRPERWEVHATEVAASGVVYRDSNVVVTAIEVPHTIWPHSFAYRIESGERTIVISGDERPSDAIVRACNGCDILLHEVYSADGLKTLPASFAAYHTRAHTSTYELADIATRARPKLLVLYHQLYFGGRTDADLLREIGSRYTGRVVSGKDLDVY